MSDDPRTSSTEAERTIVGVCLTRPNLIKQIQDSVRASDFADNACRMIYEAVTAVAARGDEPDIVLADAEAERLYPGQNLTAQMIDCATREYRAAMVGSYCDIIRDAAARARRAIEKAATVDAVEIVRCRDCKNSSRIASEKEDGMRHCWNGRGTNKGDGMSRVRSDGYCDEGKRKEAHNGEVD